jgi:hypothetical protein
MYQPRKYAHMHLTQPELLTYASRATQWWGYNTKSQELHIMSISRWINGNRKKDTMIYNKYKNEKK